jgi:hypothetical protein
MCGMVQCKRSMSLEPRLYGIPSYTIRHRILCSYAQNDNTHRKCHTPSLHYCRLHPGAESHCESEMKQCKDMMKRKRHHRATVPYCLAHSAISLTYRRAIPSSTPSSVITARFPLRCICSRPYPCFKMADFAWSNCDLGSSLCTFDHCQAVYSWTTISRYPTIMICSY